MDSLYLFVYVCCVPKDKGSKKKVQAKPTGSQLETSAGQKRKQGSTGVNQSAPVKEITKMTVEELKEKLKELGSKTTGNKEELQERLKKATTSKSSSQKTDTSGPLKKPKAGDSGTHVY